MCFASQQGTDDPLGRFFKMVLFCSSLDRSVNFLSTSEVVVQYKSLYSRA